jgi:serine/threonine-protein kinase SRPK3
MKYETYVAIKVQKSASHYTEAAYDETQILDKISSEWKKEDWKENILHYFKNDENMKEDLKDISSE